MSFTTLRSVSTKEKIMKRRAMSREVVLSVAASLALVACGDDTSTSDPATSDTEMDMPSMTSEIEITGAWARTSPAMASTGAAYVTIMSMNGDRLVEASVDASIADHAEVHGVVMADDTDESSMDMGSDSSMDMPSSEMVMREVEGIDLVAGEMLMLKPGGYHVMIIDLVAPLEMGQVFDVTLTFEKAGDVVVPVEVRDDAP